MESLCTTLWSTQFPILLDNWCWKGSTDGPSAWQFDYVFSNNVERERLVSKAACTSVAWSSSRPWPVRLWRDVTQFHAGATTWAALSGIHGGLVSVCRCGIIRHLEPGTRKWACAARTGLFFTNMLLFHRRKLSHNIGFISLKFRGTR
jgi:hypothetical protein